MAETTRPADTRPIAGILWMVVTGLCFIGVTATVKTLGTEVPAVQAAFLRFLIGLAFVAPMVFRLGPVVIGRADLGWFCARGVIHTIGVVCWFYAMTQITLAEVTAMNYLAPVYVTVGAALFLGEPLALRRALAVVAALVGALIILRPGVREVGPGHLAMLVTGLALGGSYLMAKFLTARFSPDVIVAMLSLIVTVMLAPFAWAVWVPVSWPQLGALTIVAGFATAGHYAMALAFRAAPVSVTQPVTFLQLVWSVALGALFFAEPVDLWVVVGGTVIVAAISFMAWREAVAKKRAITPTPAQTKG